MSLLLSDKLPFTELVWLPKMVELLSLLYKQNALEESRLLSISRCFKVLKRRKLKLLNSDTPETMLSLLSEKFSNSKELTSIQQL